MTADNVRLGSASLDRTSRTVPLAGDEDRDSVAGEVATDGAGLVGGEGVAVVPQAVAPTTRRAVKSL